MSGKLDSAKRFDANFRCDLLVGEDWKLGVFAFDFLLFGV